MSLPVLSKAETRAWESASWKAGRVEANVIRAVGYRVARWLIEQSRPGDRLLLLAGLGHNGDDVRAAATFLTDRRVEVISIRDLPSVEPRIRSALESRPRWVVDGLFGIGLNRPLEGGWVVLIDRINESRCPVAAMDVPSGFDADGGEPMGAAIRAEVTLTVGTPKRGLLAGGAAEWTGRLVVLDDVGLLDPPESAESELRWLERGDFKDYPPTRRADSHKGSHGHAVILAGSPGYHGAGALAAKGALSTRPGLVTWITMPQVLEAARAALSSAMVRDWKDRSSVPDSATSIVVGPGLADASCAMMTEQTSESWRRGCLPMVVDASALPWIPPGAVETASVRVITPHPGEAACMLGISVHRVQRDRPAAVRELSKKFGGCWVVLKGHHTLIGHVEGAIWVNGSGSASLAQGGTGDVLAGMVGGLIAQPSLVADPRRALCFAVWEHGRRAEGLDRVRPGWHAEDLATA